MGRGPLKSGGGLSTASQVSSTNVLSSPPRGHAPVVGVPLKAHVLQGGGREGGGEVLFSSDTRRNYGVAPTDNPFR